MRQSYIRSIFSQLSIKIGLVFSRLLDLIHQSESKRPPRIAALHDLVFDHIITFDASALSFVRSLMRLAAQGGGNLHGNKHSFQRGGNAGNIASAFASLGGNAILIAKTSELGLSLLSHFAKTKRTLDISHVAQDGELASTLSLELRRDSKLVNLMISDPGSMGAYRFEDLTERDKEALVTADYVCVVDWNQNKYGTELAEEVFRYVRKRGRGKTLLATGDPSTQPWRLKALVTRVLKRGLADILSINENELSWFFKEVTNSRATTGRSMTEKAASMCRQLQERFDARIDLHTQAWSLCVSPEGLAAAPGFVVKQFRTTGAGDAWDAASIWADAMDFDHKTRLLFANAAAAYYVSDQKGAHAGVKDVIRIMRHTNVRKIPMVGLGIPSRGKRV